MDPFCGCGTTVTTAQELRLRWIGIDVTNLALTLIRHRLKDAYGDDIEQTYQVIGEPMSVPDAEALAASDPYQFQWWALGLVGARPAEGKKGADQGIDGRIYFHDGDTAKTKQIVISVKAGKLHAPYVRDLRGVVEREQAALGVLLTLNAPTQPMRTEAASAGFYASPWGQHPRVQDPDRGRTPGRKEAGRAAAAPDQPDLQAGTEGSEKSGGAGGDVRGRLIEVSQTRACRPSHASPGWMGSAPTPDAGVWRPSWYAGEPRLRPCNRRADGGTRRWWRATRAPSVSRMEPWRATSLPARSPSSA